MTKKTGTILDYRGVATIGVAEDEAEAFNPNGRPADHETGVAYICPWEDPYAGFHEHARRCARALDNTGMPVHLRSVDPHVQWHMHFEVGGADKVALGEQYNDLLTKSIKAYSAEVYQVVTNDPLLQRLTTHRFIDPKQVAILNRFRIISCVFERDRVSEHTTRCLNRVGQVWVANRKDKDMLERCGVERVAVVPIPFFPDDPLLKLRGLERRPGPARFYHIGKWEARKAHHEMLGAFLLSFVPGEAKFYFKTSSGAPDFGDYPASPEASMHRWHRDERVLKRGWTIELMNQDIHLIKQRIPPEKILLLHKTCDVYLSLSRGEGFDMPAYDATLASNLLVYTPSGGPQDFASRGIMVPMTDTLRCHPFYKWGDAKYGDWKMEDGVSALHEAASRVQKGERPFVEISNAFSAKAVGQRMKDLIEQVVADGRKFAEAQAAK